MHMYKTSSLVFSQLALARLPSKSAAQRTLATIRCVNGTNSVPLEALRTGTCPCTRLLRVWQ